MKRRGDCEACTPTLPCVLHEYLPPVAFDEPDEETPVAQRVDTRRKSEERHAPTRV